MVNRQQDTIAAIATSAGDGGIGIVRVSGMSALAIADSMIVTKSGIEPSKFRSHTMHYGWAVEAPGRSSPGPGCIDEVLVTVMRAPRSFTREDTVEINCHGGAVALRKVLQTVLDRGARLAEPGEFTRRAFLNGRIDLSQAEAVLDIIRAKTDEALAMGMRQLSGALSARVDRLREKLIDALSVIEANIDFPEDDITPADTGMIREKLLTAEKELRSMLAGADFGRIVREGVNVAICGMPNAGKSSLLNAVLQKERSIVTPVAGTTRDIVEDFVDIRGIPVRLSDTAGLLKPRGPVERKSVAKARDCIKSADIVVLVFDGCKRLGAGDRAIISLVRGKKTIAVINKIDLIRKLKREDIPGTFLDIVEVSAKKMRNLDALESAIFSCAAGADMTSREPSFVGNIRHAECLKKSLGFVSGAMGCVAEDLPPEFAAQEIKDALSCLDDLLGKRFSEDLLESIFGRFCIGK